MKRKTINQIKDFSHYVLLVLGLFGAYYLGNTLLDFEIGYPLFKMFAWFLVSIILLDKLIHKVLDI